MMWVLFYFLIGILGFILYPSKLESELVALGALVWPFALMYICRVKLMNLYWEMKKEDDD